MAEVLGSVVYPPTPDRPWTIRVTYVRIGGRPAVGAVEIYAVDPEAIREAVPGWPALAYRPPGTHPVTSVGLRLPLGSMLARYVHGRRKTPRVVAPAVSDAGSLRGPGRPPVYSREHFENVADIYREALAEGRPPTQAVATRFGVSASAAAKWVATARYTWGLLPRTSKGRSVGWDGS